MAAASRDWRGLFSAETSGWFSRRFGAPTEIQSRAWPLIAAGGHVLLPAPTGSGKTLTAFLWGLDSLLTGCWEPGRLRVLYVSPLKALNNDIRDNLTRPLAELRHVFAHAGRPTPGIGVMVRSGDTPQSERQRMWRRPPEILVTTPESLSLLLLSQPAPLFFSGLRTVIVDEVHALFASRRGVQLAASLEWLTRYAGEFQRVALSATVRPLSEVGAFVGGYLDGVARPVSLVSGSGGKRYELSVALAGEADDAGRDDASHWGAVASRVRREMSGGGSTLVFCNGRASCEKLSRWVNGEGSEPVMFPYHGSLSREVRLDVERRMKRGELRAVAATSALELGIDVGAIDRVVLVDGASSVASAAQRIGRSGHRVGAVSRACLLAGSPLRLLEALSVREAVLAGELEPSHAPRCCLDYLAQWVAALSVARDWRVEELYALVRRVWHYRDLPEAVFRQVLAMAGGLDGRSVGGTRLQLIDYDEASGTVRARRRTRRTLCASGGTIPPRGMYLMRRESDRTLLGELDEEFVWELRVGEAVLLGSRCWRVERITHEEVLVSAIRGNTGIPFWRAEPNDRSFELSCRIAERLTRWGEASEAGCWREMAREEGLEEGAGEALAALLVRQRRLTGTLPGRHQWVLERVEPPAGSSDCRCSVLHTFCGGRVNRPLAMALGEALRRATGERWQCHCGDDAICLAGSRPLERGDILEAVTEGTLMELLRTSLEGSSYFMARFRESAGRALLLTRPSFRRRMPFWRLRADAAQLWEKASRVPDFPVVLEAWRTCLEDDFDLPALRGMLRELASGETRLAVVTVPEASPMAHDSQWAIVNEMMYRPDGAGRDAGGAMSEAARGADWVRELLGTGALEAVVPREVADEFARRRARTAPGYAPRTVAELTDVIADRWLVPEAEWRCLLDAMRRDGLDDWDGEPVPPSASDGVWEWASSLPGVSVLEDGAGVRVGVLLSRRVAEWRQLWDGSPERLSGCLARWLSGGGAVTAAELASQWRLPPERVTAALEGLCRGGEAAALLLERLDGQREMAFAEREALAAMLRLARRRRTLAAVRTLTPEAFQMVVARQQGLGGEGGGREALLERLRRLAGVPLRPAELETQWLPARLSPYDTAWLDSLCQQELWCTGTPDGRLRLLEEPDLEVLPPPPDSAAGADADAWSAFWAGRSRCLRFELVRRRTEGKATGAVLAERAAPTAPSLSRRLSGLRRCAERLSVETPLDMVPVTWPASGSGDAVSELERGKERVRMLLDRYGVVFRELLEREEAGFRWREVFPALRVMELSGEVVSGCFVEGVRGLQFTAAELLPELERGEEAERVVWLSATDPASLCGLGGGLLPSAFPRRVAGSALVFVGGRLRLVGRRRGMELELVGEGAESSFRGEWLAPYISAMWRQRQPMLVVEIRTVNGRPATDVLPRPELERLFRVETDAGAYLLTRRWADGGL